MKSDASRGALVERIVSTPFISDEKKAQSRLDDLQQRIANKTELSTLAELLRGEALQKLVLAIADHSNFLWQLAYSDPERLQRLVTTAPEEAAKQVISAQRNCYKPFLKGAVTRDDIAASLRKSRGEMALLVALADIVGVWDVETVTDTLSRFADASVGGALDVVLHEAASLGRLNLPDPEKPSTGCGVVVLAFGKHGSNELNYSSDIDLVLFFDPKSPAIPEEGEPATIYSRIALQLARLLQERTPFGYVHRVDYRLRPDPGSTPTAMALPSAYAYYESVGQNWERAAMIKARPAAGEIALGENFLKELTPFVWRKYFDFASIADVHAMKRQIHAVRGHEEIAVAGHDIKLGRGGIREIEFFVQTQQLVFGGRRPVLRGKKTLDMLVALRDENWISPEACGELSEAYKFLRTVEHRLQMVADEQTQRLPDDEKTLTKFAKFCGYSNLKAFSKALTGYAHQVQKHYALLFEDGPELATDVGSLVFTGSTDDPETLASLKKMGFKNPEAVAETVRGWHFGRRSAITTKRAREVLTEITPALLEALGGTADPDAALDKLDRAFGTMRASAELLTILQSHDRLRFLFADLLGTAPRLADTVAQSPHVLDAIIDPAFAVPKNDEASIEKQMRQLLGKPENYEDFLDRIRDAARQMKFVDGARMLSGVLSPDQTGRVYSAIAQAAVRCCFEYTRREFEEEYGKISGGRIAILGLGRLGTYELTASSDLDLIVIYDFDEENRESDGARSLDAIPYHARLTQRLVGALTVPTRRGKLYDVDLRLRPHGGKGPVAVQFKGFLDYQRTEAELWEHMALSRARVIAGDEGFVEEVSDTLRQILSAPRDKKSVFHEVRTMRNLIAKEKGDADPWDLKLAAGGLTDLDFIAQAYILTYAADYPSVIGQRADKVYEIAAGEGLMEDAEAHYLVEAHRLFGDILQWQRLTIESHFSTKTVPQAIFRRLAAVAGLPNEKVLLAHLNDMRKKVREIYDRLLA
ncbi:bifunctional [glutamine synthetase] adenylyltransferase/[glutamine synthetase]-adenylyl-L-tyrosine phosphorylase [Microvirga sp. W0021]|uniref:Bifunctional glutamine synthetase adenylyltransferase/adenylyl-removing enzyme n=1 Tax=Hohaiivirga grylli TaxID=3133970 RepID=A0ABV0BKV7_9HYPH